MTAITAVGWLCVFVGLWFSIVAFGARARRMALLRNCVRVKGKVVRVIETTTAGDTVATYSPVVQYRAADGATHELTLYPRQQSNLPRVGASVPVFYDKSAPQNAIDAKRVWDVNLACVLSVLSILVGIGLIYTELQE